MKIKIILCLFLSYALKAQIKIDGVAAVVGKNVVLESDVEKFKKELENKPGAKKLSDCEILELVMNRKLLAHFAVIDSVKVSDNQIDATVERNINYFKQQLGSVEAILDFYGFDSEILFRQELRKIEKENALISGKQQQIIKNITITPQEVKTYFNSLKEKNKLPQLGEQISLSQLVMEIHPQKKVVSEVVEKLKAIKKQVMEGASFKMKALVYSKDPSVIQNGGFFKISKESPFVKEFKEVAFSLDEGDISEPFKTVFGYHIILLEKIKGKDLELRHILMNAEITETQLSDCKTKISKIKDSILAGDLTFKKAVQKYSDDKRTKTNNGLVINTQTQGATFELTKMDPVLYGQINNLGTGEISEPFLETNREGKKTYKIFLIKKRENARPADYVKDYVRIQDLAIAKKKQTILANWYLQNIKKTYIKIAKIYKKCNFKYAWTKVKK